MEPKGIKSFADEIGRGAVGRCRDERIGRWPPAMNDRRAFRRSADRRTPTRQSKRMRDRDHRAARLRALRIAVSLAGLADPEFNMTREPIVAVYGCGRPSGARDRRASFIDLRECLDAIKLRQIRHSHRADGSAAARRNFSPGERRRRGSLPRGIKGPARIAMTCSRGAGFRPPPRSYVALTAARRVAAARRPEDPAGLGAGRQRRSFFQVQITCERSWRFWPAWVWRSLKCQVVRLLTAKLEDFAPRRKPGVRAGLDGSPFVTVDDTGPRHAGKGCSTSASASIGSPRSAPGRENRAWRSFLACSEAWRADGPSRDPSRRKAPARRDASGQFMFSRCAMGRCFATSARCEARSSPQKSIGRRIKPSPLANVS